MERIPQSLRDQWEGILAAEGMPNELDDPVSEGSAKALARKRILLYYLERSELNGSIHERHISEVATLKEELLAQGHSADEVAEIDGDLVREVQDELADMERYALECITKKLESDERLGFKIPALIRMVVQQMRKEFPDAEEEILEMVARAVADKTVEPYH